jgi:hypothetical protein
MRVGSCALQGALLNAIRTVSQGPPGSPGQLPAEAPSSRVVAFLEALPCLNPFSATSLAALPCSLQSLLHASTDELQERVPEVPRRSLDLFLAQATWGTPVLGVQAAGGHMPSLQPGPL